MEKKELFFLADIARANIEVAAMQAENDMRRHRGETPAYGEEAFLKIIENNGLGHNQTVIKLME